MIPQTIWTEEMENGCVGAGPLEETSWGSPDSAMNSSTNYDDNDDDDHGSGESDAAAAADDDDDV